jgi:hypothetical protein
VVVLTHGQRWVDHAQQDPRKFLDSLVAIYNGTTGNIHKHIASTHLSLHLAYKCQTFKPKRLILISTFAFVSTNNIHAFIESGNNAVIERVHAFLAQLVVNCNEPLSLATNVDLNKVIQAASCLKLRSYVLMTFNKIDRALISMFSKFTMCINTFIIKVCVMYMPTSYDKLANEYANSNHSQLVVCNDGLHFVIK